MTWSQFHRRHRLVQDVLADIAVSGEPQIPARWRAEVAAEFGGFEEFLQEVQARWYRTYDARLDALLEEQPYDMHAALVQLEDDITDAMPEARRLLDAHLDHPALAAMHVRHQRMLYTATGIYLDPVRNAPPPATCRPSRYLCTWISRARPSTI